MSESDFKEEYLKAFGESLKKIRIESAKKSLRMFAYEADIPCATLSRLEHGTRIPNIITLEMISSGLNWSICDFIREIENNIPDNIKNSEL